MAEINVELDGKKLWADFKDYLDGTLTGIALQTNEALADGDGIPSVKLRVTIDPGDGQGLVNILVDVKIAFLIQVLAAASGRLKHLQDIRAMVSSIKH